MMADGGSDKFVLTWKLKYFSKLLLMKKVRLCSPGAFADDKDCPVGHIKINGDCIGGKPEDFILFYFQTGFGYRKNFLISYFTAEVIGEENDILSSTETEFDLNTEKGCERPCFIMRKELSDYFSKCRKDEIIFRFIFKGWNYGKSKYNRLDMVSYLWEIHPSDPSCDHLDRYISDLFPFKIRIMEIDKRLVIKPEFSGFFIEACGGEVSLRDEYFRTLSRIGLNFCNELDWGHVTAMKQSISWPKSYIKDAHVRCDLYLKSQEPKSDFTNREDNDVKIKTYDHCNSYLHTDMKNMLSNKIHCDVQLRVDGKLIPAHKCVLAARSPVFLAMFDHDMLEASTGIVDIPDCEWEVFDSFLQFLYTEELGAVDYKILCGLLLMADKYQVSRLTKKCSVTLKSVLSKENVCEVLSIADLVNDRDLKASALNFFVNNTQSIIETPEWTEWSRSHPDLQSEVQVSIVQHKLNEIELSRKNLKYKNYIHYKS